MKEQNIGKDFFSVNNLDKLAEIDGHMAFIENLIEKYSRSSQDAACDWNFAREQLSLIRKKVNEKKLNISVIGEFSTGKSTFINAFLRNDLLASSALQGTTAASTIIDYGSQYRVHLEYLSGGREEERTYSSLSDLKEALERHTTNYLTAKQLKSVRVYLPSELLKNNFRIIDTPGTNVTEAWHEDVTVRTLQNDSDLSIILISAEKPVTETTLSFVKKHLTSILPQCVFIVTKLDLILQKEREQLISYIKTKLEWELELQNAVVLPYISPMVLDSQSIMSGSQSADRELLELSIETEHKLMEHTLKQKAIALTKKLASLIDEMYISISRKMEHISGDYEEKLNLLNRSHKTDLSVFIRQEKLSRLAHFDDAVGKKRDEIEEGLLSAADNAKKEILGKLDEKSNIDQLKYYISNALGDDCSRQAGDMIAKMNSYYGQIRKQFKEEIRTYNKAFKENYEALNIIPVDMARSQYDLPGNINFETADISTTANYIAEKLASENKAFFGGMGAGAAVGTAIAPGVGTVIGGIIGFVAGGVFAPDTGAVREECKEKLKPQIINYYSNICDRMISALERYSIQIRQCLADEIDGYLERYRREVERQINLKNSQKSVVQSKIKELDTDRNQIRNRKQHLKSVILQLNSWGRKEN